MNITLAGGNQERSYNRDRSRSPRRRGGYGGNRDGGNRRGGNRGGGNRREGGGRREKKEEVTQEQLDAEMDAYLNDRKVTSYSFTINNYSFLEGVKIPPEKKPIVQSKQHQIASPRAFFISSFPFTALFTATSDFTITPIFRFDRRNIYVKRNIHIK